MFCEDISQDEKEEDEDEQLNSDNDPEIAMVRRGQQMLHFVVCIDHVCFCSIDIITKFLNTHILSLNFSVKVLSLVLSRLDYANDLVKLVVLIADHLLLVLEDLTIVKITSLIILSIFTSLILYLLLLSGESSLIVLHGAIVLRQLPIDDLFDIVDEVNALFDFFFVHTWVLVWLILIIVHELIKVAQVSLKCGPGRLHQVFGTRNRLPRSRVCDFINLVLETLDSLLGIPVVFLKLVGTHSVLTLYLILIIINIKSIKKE